MLKKSMRSLKNSANSIFMLDMTFLYTVFLLSRTVDAHTSADVDFYH